MKKIILLATTFFVLLSASLFAKDVDVGIVQKIKVICPCDIDFLKKTFGEKNEDNAFYIDDVRVPNGEFFIVTKSFDENKYGKTYAAIFSILANKKARLGIPSLAKFKCSREMDYIYTGSWTVTFDPYTFEITDIKVEDEFDQAKEWLAKKRNAKKAESLLRVELQPLTEDD